MREINHKILQTFCSKVFPSLVLFAATSWVHATYTGINLPGALDPTQVSKVTLQLPAQDPVTAVDEEACQNNLGAGEVCLPGFAWYVRSDTAFSPNVVGTVSYLDAAGKLLAKGQISTNAAGQFTNSLTMDLYNPASGEPLSGQSQGFSLDRFYSFTEMTFQTLNSDRLTYVSPRISFGVDLSQSYLDDASLLQGNEGIVTEYFGRYSSQLGVFNQALPLVSNPQELFHLPMGVRAVDFLGSDYYIGSSLRLGDGSSVVGAYPRMGTAVFENAWKVGVDYSLNTELSFRVGYDNYLEKIDCSSVQQGGGDGTKVQVRPPAPPVKEFMEGAEKPAWDPAKEGGKPPVRPVGDPEIEALIEEVIATGSRIVEVEMADPQCVRTVTVVDSGPSTSAPTTATTTTSPPTTTGSSVTPPTLPIGMGGSFAPDPSDGIASITGSTTTCPYPTGRISAHMVDAEVYTAFLYPGSSSYTDAADLLAQLQAKVAPRFDPTATCGRCIQNLELWGHGAPGGGYVTLGPGDGFASSGGTATSLSGAATTNPLQGIGALMCVGGSVTFNQCNAGKGANGTASLQAIADLVGVPVSGPEDEIKGCRIFGGALTSYKTQQPSSTATTPGSRPARDVSAP